MNAGMKNGINLLMILVLFISCVQEKEDNNVLRRVEACMELFPDSALSLLSQIECPECMRGQQRADYALLLTQALDKNYLDNLQSDSLIMIAVEYYKQEGDNLVCQNCGNSFTMNQIGESAGGCNPWPILEEDKTETDSEIKISYEFLKESSDIFENWKVN